MRGPRRGLNCWFGLPGGTRTPDLLLRRQLRRPNRGSFRIIRIHRKSLNFQQFSGRRALSACRCWEVVYVANRTQNRNQNRG